MNSKIVIGIVLGIVVGLIVGLVVGAMLILPTSTTKTGTGTNNQVQVSGTIQSGAITGNTLYFQNVNESMLASAPIVNGQYSVLLTGGQSYNIYSYNPTVFEGERGYSPDSNFNPFYLPSGVTTYTENLVSS